MELIMDLYEKNGNILYILNVLKKYSDEAHPMQTTEIQRKIKEIYDVDIDTRTIRRNINLLKYKLQYDISTREENKKGYYINRNPETDFEPGEIRAIIDTFSYARYIVPSIGKSIIEKCKNLQNVYENQKLRNYKIYSRDNKTENMEVIKNIEDISEAIRNLNKIKFEYWKYEINQKLEKVIVSKPVVTPYAIVYNEQEFYLIGIKEGQENFFHYRLDRIKNLKQLDEKRTIAKTSSQIQAFAESAVEMFGGEAEEIEAICDKILLEAVLDQFGKNITIIKNDENTFKLKLNVHREGFILWALRNLELVEVVKPLSVREEIKRRINEGIEKYR